jgi:ArsR family transcriptional regulator
VPAQNLGKEKWLIDRCSIIIPRIFLVSFEFTVSIRIIEKLFGYLFYMTYVCVINHKAMTYHKTSLFDADLQDISTTAKLLSHPARLAIVRYLAKTNTCISGDITSEIPLSRTTVSQHLQELKKAGIIQGEVDGIKVCYCLSPTKMMEIKKMFHSFFEDIDKSMKSCCASNY